MKTQEIPLTSGAFAWAVYSHPYHLPEDLPHRTLVKVIENRRGDVEVTVQDRTGRQWRLMRCHLVPRLRYHYSHDEKWYPESTPRAQAILIEEIRRQWQELRRLRERIENLYWRVRRSAGPQDLERFHRLISSGDPIADYDPTPPPPDLTPFQLDALSRAAKKEAAGQEQRNGYPEEADAPSGTHL